MRGEPPSADTPVLRGAVVSLAGLCAAVAVVAIELNRLPDGERPAVAAQLWPNAPDARRDQAMRDIGLAAARLGTVPEDAVRTMHWLARSEPLRAEPFLVEATVAATAGDGVRAEQLFANAAARDPRSVLAHFSLADRYLRTGRLVAGLAEISIMAQLVPSATNSLAGPIAVYARQPTAEHALRQFFARTPSLAPLVLGELAKDPTQADRVIAFGEALPPSGDKGWQLTLVQTLIDKHQYPRALATWRRLAGVASFAGLYNPQFAAISAPPPFNWAPFEGSGALAEPAPGGGLKLVYYGRADVVVTRQLLVLAPGRYTLAMELGSGPVSTADAANPDPSSGLAWQIGCADGGAVLGTLPLRSGAQSRASLTFAVPAGCGAQWLSLRGTAGAFGDPVAVTVSGLTLTSGAAS